MNMQDLLVKYKAWRYKNTFLLTMSLVAVFYFGRTDIWKMLIIQISELGYVGSLIAGMFFVLTFTVVPAGIILFSLAQIYDPFLVAITAGVGAVVGDYIIFKFLKDNVFSEVKPIFMRLGGSNISRIISTPYFAWLAPVIGAIIIASPFPDEIGVGLMGLSRIKNWQFLIITFLLNSLGIFIVVTAASSTF